MRKEVKKHHLPKRRYVMLLELVVTFPAGGLPRLSV